MVNELVYRSALSILIRGGFVNLLKAALNVEMPIVGFYDKLADYAKEIGSDYCYEILQAIDYKNKTFEKTSAPKKSSSTEKQDSASKQSFDFDKTKYKVEGDKLIKYLGQEEVVIPEGCKKIGDSAFIGCKNLEKVLLPESLEVISKLSFYSTCLREVIAGEKVKKVGTEAFNYNEKIEKLVFKGAKILFAKNAIPTRVKEVYIYSMDTPLYLGTYNKIVDYPRFIHYYIRNGSALDREGKLLQICGPEYVHYLDD